jgi:L-alanine-DL-glutamate epimerase-like enolase superfamily enzyme
LPKASITSGIVTPRPGASLFARIVTSPPLQNLHSYCLEFSIEPRGWTEGLYEPELEVRDGEAAIPDGPGWGVEIRPAWLEAAERQLSRLE